MNASNRESLTVRLEKMDWASAEPINSTQPFEISFPEMHHTNTTRQQNPRQR